MALFEWLNFEERGGRTAFGKMLRRFNGRILGGIRLRVHDQDKRRPKFSFEPVEETGTDGGAGLVTRLLGVSKDQAPVSGTGNIVDVVDVRVPAMAEPKNPIQTNG
jgi:hypothetical protein